MWRSGERRHEYATLEHLLIALVDDEQRLFLHGWVCGGTTPCRQRADGSLPPSHDEEARQAYLEEGTPLRPSGAVDLGRAFWQPRLQAQ